MCILFVYTLFKVVSRYDLSVLSLSVTGLKNLDGGGWLGWALSRFFWEFWIILTLQDS